MMIKRQQIRALDEVPLGVFLGRVADHVRETLGTAALEGYQLTAAVRHYYAAARRASMSSQRQIAGFILDQIREELANK